ncbi:hypothetical protein K437DRAFT_260361 [Tilletiaria anomala UBC 951]|uniref:Xylanolytic transcriptional activator regulatory domain-containing protein n=1 Tax=Tilletiaria anomala (strain ATCC 24038 / CBS 436.72 / UBC 951) TaxID=1037660 RepID=A0A066V9S1_TILAU|nr:uncharacterized protein K437DRAFT_260361 [Tilletiaria anomala UBC 951]KDN35504.1 hypothetical protein K437DRAFT_260361 [Tilletiaria anomala UBC 951]
MAAGNDADGLPIGPASMLAQPPMLHAGLAAPAQHYSVHWDPTMLPAWFDNTLSPLAYSEEPVNSGKMATASEADFNVTAAALVMDLILTQQQEPALSYSAPSTVTSTSAASSSSGSPGSGYFAPQSMQSMAMHAVNSSGSSSSSTLLTQLPVNSNNDVDSGILSALQDWPTPLTQHLDLYRVNFGNHLPFIHLPTKMTAADLHAIDEDLLRAMAIVGGNYDESASGGEDRGRSPAKLKSCDYYGCSVLKQRVLRSVEDMQSQPFIPADGSNAALFRIRMLTRRTQTLVLIQLVAMFSESRKHMIAAKHSHGSLIAVARELIQERKKHAKTKRLDVDWLTWVAKEEAARTLLTVYVVDSLRCICFNMPSSLNKRELSSLSEFDSDELWNAQDADMFNRLRNGAQDVREKVDTQKADGDVASSQRLFAILTICSDISRLFDADTATRQQLSQQLEAATINSNDRSTTSMSLQAIDRSLVACDTSLAAAVEQQMQTLTSWLSCLQASTAEHSPPRGNRPFLQEVMPWYWMGQHLLALLRARIVVPTGSTAVTPNPSNIAQRLALYGDGEGDDNESTDMAYSDSSNNIMHLIVQMRTALRRVDGGALMYAALGTNRLRDALPALPPSVSAASITGFFPQLGSI